MLKYGYASFVFLAMFVVSQTALGDFWVNELNYESDPNVEIVRSPISAAVDLNTVTWHLYNGANGTVYSQIPLNTFTVGSSTNGYTIFRLSGFTIQSGNPSGQADSPDGWAISVGGTVVEFKSYEGSFTATNGVAAGLTSADIGVRQDTGFPSQASSQLTGTGNKASDFGWIPGQGPSYGQVNLSQTLTAVPEPSSMVLIGLVACTLLVRRMKKTRCHVNNI